MKKLLFLTSYPSPYRVNFFDTLGKEAEVTVLFSDQIAQQTHRSAQWFIDQQGNYRSHQLHSSRIGVDGRLLCFDVISWLRKPWDAIIISGYSSPTAILAMLYLKLRRIPFYMEVDGGLIRKDSALQYKIKRFLIRLPSFYLSSGEATTRYLCHYGADREKTFLYPFSSLWERDILKSVPSREEKQALREKLGLPEEKLIVFVGRFTLAKGMPELLHAVPKLDPDTGVCFIGGEPSEEHLAFCRDHALTRVHFVGFQKKDALQEYYRAADLMVLPTKTDVWGLVVNEAMACGLPVITTDQCVAGLELVKNGVNGYVVPVGDQQALEEKILTLLRGDYGQLGRNALETIRPYTIENMVKAHVDILT